MPDKQKRRKRDSFHTRKKIGTFWLERVNVALILIKGLAPSVFMTVFVSVFVAKSRSSSLMLA